MRHIFSLACYQFVARCASRGQGEGPFRSLASAAPSVGSAWCDKVDCFSGEPSRFQCTLLARSGESYDAVLLIFTGLAPTQRPSNVDWKRLVSPENQSTLPHPALDRKT